MKQFILLTSILIIIFLCSGFSQEADLSIPLIISDNAGNTKTLYFGLDSSATDGIDIQLDESDLPPFPPAGVFESRFILPEGGFSGALSSYKDYRQGNLPYTGTKEHRLKYQIGSGASQIIVKWDFDSTVTGLLQDLAGGAIVNKNMFGADSFVVTLPDFITSLKVIISYDNVVPVELTSFTALQIERSVFLRWTTATETNNRGFNIERTRDFDWETIGFVNGAGTSTGLVNYEFTDNNISSAGTYSYRLKQIDYNGSFSYSATVSVVAMQPQEYQLSQNFPNPFNPTTRIDFTLPEQAFVRVTIYNQIGQKVDEIQNGLMSSGYHSVVWDASSFTSGVYFYELQANNFNSIKKMILIK